MRTEVVIGAANGLLSAVEDALEFQKRIVERTTHQEDPPTTELQVTPTSSVELPMLIPRDIKRPMMALALWMLLQHWTLPFEESHEEPPLPGVGAATAARAQAEVTMRASLENIARAKSE